MLDTSAEDEIESIDPTIACKVLFQKIDTILKSQINLPPVVNYLKAKEVIDDADKNSIMALMNVDDQWRKLIEIVNATIVLDKEVFLIFLNAIKVGNSVRAKALSDKLYKVINIYIVLYIVIIWYRYTKIKHL